MKKIMLLLCVIVILFTSCSRKDFMSIDNNTVANTAFEKVIKAAQEKDANALKKLFSKNSVLEINNLDESIEEFFDYFQGKVISYDDWGGSYSTGGISEGNRWIVVHSTYDVKMDTEDYRFSVTNTTIDKNEPDNIGISSIYAIKTKNDIEPEYAYWGDGEDTPGIHIDVKSEHSY